MGSTAKKANQLLQHGLGEFTNMARTEAGTGQAPIPAFQNQFSVKIGPNDKTVWIQHDWVKYVKHEPGP